MNSAKRKLLWDSIWTIGGFSITQALRLATNIVLTRLLAPEIFGIMTIVNTIRTGFELFSDTGIGQNIVQSRKGEDPDFYNTAWTVQLIRGILLWLASVICGPIIANFYQIPILGTIFPVIGLVFIITGLSSTSVFLLQKQMMVAKRNLFDVFFDFVSAIVHIVLAVFNPTIWALVFGGIVASVAKASASHFIIGGRGNRLHLSRKHIQEIFGFGKWIFLATIAYFLATSLDRLYLGRMVPLALLGVYSIARILSDAASMMASRLTGLILFPYISSMKDLLRLDLRDRIYRIRFRMLMLAAVGMATIASSSNFIVQILYDSRYWDAKWMLPLLCIGSWFSIMSNLNESALLGLGRPKYSAIANTAKLGFLILGLPLGFQSRGLGGAILVIIMSELVRYIFVFLGARREQFGFLIQEGIATLLMFTIILTLDMVRWTLGITTIVGKLSGLMW